MAIAEKVGVSRPTMLGWRQRYQAKGIGGWEDEAHSGWPWAIDRVGPAKARHCS